MGGVKARTDVTSELFGVVGRFRRQLRRSAGRAFDPARLSESQSELLWLVGRRPGISVSAAAAELGLVPNTASTLVTKLVSGGFLLRAAADTDRRVCQLRLTESAQQIVDESRRPAGIAVRGGRRTRRRPNRGFDKRIGGPRHDDPKLRERRP